MTQSDETLAVIDLGSNSFHMIVAKLNADQSLHIIDRIKERVRLAEGMGPEKMLHPDAKYRAITQLRRFRERLSEFDNQHIRVVGTDTFRKAKNGQTFLNEAIDALGRPISIISGLEEARLIYKGVCHDLLSQKKRLVIDIGGGSTELIIGIGQSIEELASTHMGCVSWTERFFQKGKITEEAFLKASQAAEQNLNPIARKYRKSGWREVIGTSGTIKAVGAALQRSGITDGSITTQGLLALEKQLLKSKKCTHINLPGISESRAEVLPGGIAILSGLFRSLRITEMLPVNAALREGVLVEMIGRLYGEDIRNQTVKGMMRRFTIDRSQARRIEITANEMFNDVQASWALPLSTIRLLGWAAKLLEIGMSIAFSGYQKHGAYIIKHADMRGFTRQEQAIIALLIRGHRGKISPDDYQQFVPTINENHYRALIILRLAAKFHRRRSPKNLPKIGLEATNNQVNLLLPIGFLENRHLTHADLSDEIEQLKRIGKTLRLVETKALGVFP